MLENIYKKLEKMYSETVSIRRYLHQYPEVSFQEEKTPAYIAEYLCNLGIDVKTGVGGLGVVGFIKGGNPGKTVALRADFDALPIQDEKEVEYRSKVPGVMHACGHDAHTATLLSVASAIAENRENLHGNVVLIFQFAEEVAPGGAKPMIEAGCLDGVDVIFGTHLWSTIPVGKIGYRIGPVMAAADKFTVEIQGKGGHGAHPDQTCDPIIVGTNYIQLLQQIVSRTIDPVSSAVITVGSFHSGDAFNVIPDKAQIVGTVRTFDPNVQEIIIGKMEAVLKGLCIASGANYTFQYEKGYPAVVNHQEETKFLVQCAKEVVGDEHVYEIAPSMGGEDFAYYLEKIPGTFFFTGAGNASLGAKFPHHHPKFDIDEKAMLYAAKALVTATVKYLDMHSKQSVTISK